MLLTTAVIIGLKNTAAGFVAGTLYCALEHLLAQASCGCWLACKILGGLQGSQQLCSWSFATK